MTLFVRTTLLAVGLALASSPAMAGCNLWLQFDFGSARPGPQGVALLDRVAAMYPRSSYYIVGHADAPGSEFENLVISRARTEAVAAHLVARGATGIRSQAARAQTRMLVVDHGPKRVNRRVEVYVSPCSEAALSGS